MREFSHKIEKFGLCRIFQNNWDNACAAAD